MAKPTFDPKCYDLAEQFLADTSYAGNEDLIVELAGLIQEVIEDFISDLDLIAAEEEDDE